MAQAQEIRIPGRKLTARGYLHVPKYLQERYNLHHRQRFDMVLIPIESDEDKEGN